MLDFEPIYIRFRAGDVTLLYREMYSQLLMYARNLLGEELDILAEDCVQDAVMNAYTHIDSLNSVSDWHSYLLTCIRNKVFNYQRKRSARQHYLDSDDTEQTTNDISLDMIEQETLTRLYAAIDLLPEDLRQIFSMSFEQGLKTAEIAAALRVSERTVKSRKHRMLDFLRARLGTTPDDSTLLLLLSLAATPIPN